MDKKYRVDWTSLKYLAAKKFIGFHSCELSNATEVFLIEEGKPSFWTTIYKAGDPHYDDDPAMQDARSDWETHYQANANGPSRPRTRDGRDKTQPVTVDAGQWHNWHGIGDSNSALRQGPLMGVRLWWETIETVRTMRYQILNPDHTIGDPTNVDGSTFKMRWRYRDPVWLAGGRLRHLNARFGDAVSMRVIAPQADLTPNGFNEGNCDVVSGLVVPAIGDGAYDVDLSLSAPVDAPGVDGMYDFTFPASGLGRGTIVANGSQGGYYNLYAVDVPLTEFISHDLLLGDDTLTYDPQNINASLVLAEYMFECELFKPDPGDDTPLEVVWRVLATRYRTT